MQPDAQHMVNEAEQDQGAGRGPDLHQQQAADLAETEAPQQRQHKRNADQGIVVTVKNPHVILVAAVGQGGQEGEQRPLVEHQQQEHADHRHGDGELQESENVLGEAKGLGGPIQHDAGQHIEQDQPGDLEHLLAVGRGDLEQVAGQQLPQQADRQR